MDLIICSLIFFCYCFIFLINGRTITAFSTREEGGFIAGKLFVVASTLFTSLLPFQEYILTLKLRGGAKWPYL